jgi:hypothetical protein
MNKLFTILAIVTALTLSGCSSSSKKAGPLDGEWQGKGKNFAGKKFSKVMNWAPGQYVVMGTINDGDRESITKSLVVRKEAGGWVYETITTNVDKEVTGMQMRVKGMESAFTKNDASKIKVDWIKILQKDGTIQKIEGDAMIFYNAILQSTWNSLLISGTSTPGGALTVPAGTFAGTTKVHTKVKVLFMTVEGDSYLHPDVPINGVVKSVSKDVVTELIDFGFNGKAVIQ